jgi:hypothetical protein
MSQPTDPDERERWRIAFDRCDDGTCCAANAKYHRPRCPHRAARLAQRPPWRPEVVTISEIGGRRGCIWMVSSWIAIPLLAVALVWWVMR